MALESSLLHILQGLVGSELSYTDEFEVEKGMIKRFAIAIGDPNPIYYDEEFARTTSYEDIVAPPTFLFEWNHHRHNVLPPEERRSIFNGLERQPRLLRGINEYQVVQQVRAGDIIRTKSRIAEVYEKQGRSGQLVFMVTETDYFNQKKETLGKSRDTYILLP
ncbi:MaoC family dehydratase N-terminal domain-containing protein [Chloroflexota bacterium]